MQTGLRLSSLILLMLHKSKYFPIHLHLSKKYALSFILCARTRLDREQALLLLGRGGEWAAVLFDRIFQLESPCAVI